MLHDFRRHFRERAPAAVAPPVLQRLDPPASAASRDRAPCASSPRDCPSDRGRSSAPRYPPRIEREADRAKTVGAAVDEVAEKDEFAAPRALRLARRRVDQRLEQVGRPWMSPMAKISVSAAARARQVEDFPLKRRRHLEAKLPRCHCKPPRRARLALMFLNFFAELRKARVPVTPREFLDLMRALDRDVPDQIDRGLLSPVARGAGQGRAPSRRVRRGLRRRCSRASSSLVAGGRGGRNPRGMAAQDDRALSLARRARRDRRSSASKS